MYAQGGGGKKGGGKKVGTKRKRTIDPGTDAESDPGTDAESDPGSVAESDDNNWCKQCCPGSGKVQGHRGKHKLMMGTRRGGV
jgi:hypothetical protein